MRPSLQKCVNFSVLEWNYIKTGRWSRFATRGLCTTSRNYKEDTPSRASKSVQSPKKKESNSKAQAQANATTAVKEIKRQVIFSGIQPTGIPHLGNYLGALRTWKEYQDTRIAQRTAKSTPNALFFSIVDLHGLTLFQDPILRQQNIRNSYASLLAIGLSNTESNVFVQSHIPEHAELMWLLSTLCSTGMLSRMTQWKSKIGIEDQSANDPSKSRGIDSLSEKEREQLKLGLFSYPVLQAADVLLYHANIVPVGEDQLQHLELTRSLARTFLSMYGKADEASKSKRPLLTVPEVVLSPAKRVMSLTDPTKKMSKSDPNPKSMILITDSKGEVESKLKAAKTDSITGITYDPVNRPGVSNLIEILKHTTKSDRSCEELAQEHSTTSLGALKSLVAAEVNKAFEGIGEKYKELTADGSTVIEKEMHEGAGGARPTAAMTMEKLRHAVGLITYRDTQQLRTPIKLIKTGRRSKQEHVDSGTASE